MNERTVESRFFYYVLPSMMTMLLCGLYSIIDGIFIGRAIGDNGLAAINIAWPVTAIILATGTGIGTGGAALMSICKGRDDAAGACKALGNTLTLLLLAATVLSVLCGLFLAPLLHFLGAEGTIYTMASDYSTIIVMGAVFQIFGTGLSPILRNDNRPRQAMLIMGCGLITNIILDALFVVVWQTGLGGAALATVIAQCLTALPCAWYLAHKKGVERLQAPDFHLCRSTVKSIATIGISPFGFSTIWGIVIMLNNWQCLNYGGAAGVAAYTIMSYILSPAQSLMNGVGEGSQPLVSFSYGAGRYDIMKRLIGKALKLALGCGILLSIVIILADSVIPLFFGASPTAAPLVRRSLFFMGCGLPFMALVKVSSSYFYATENMRYSTLLIYSDALLLTPLFLTIFPKIWGLDGIWLVYPATQGTLLLLGVLCWRQHLHTLNQPHLEVSPA